MIALVFDFNVVVDRVRFNLEILPSLFFIHLPVVIVIDTTAMIKNITSIVIVDIPIDLIVICEELIDKIILFSFDFEVKFLLLFF